MLLLLLCIVKDLIAGIIHFIAIQLLALASQK